MRRIRYLLIFYLFIISIGSYAYSETISTNGKDSQQMNFTEEQEQIPEVTEEIRIRKDEFDEIVEQLQGMKALLENMKQDYEMRLNEMQEKISALEKERTQMKEKAFQPIIAAEVPGTGTEEVRIKREDYEAVVGKLQEMETNLENVEADYDSRLKKIEETYNTSLEEMQQKVAVSPQPGSTEAEKWTQAQPITLLSKGKSYMNVSFDGLFAAAGSTDEDLETLETGAHDPNQRGFTVQNIELTMEGAVDPYFNGAAHIIYQLDTIGETGIEVEEAYLTSMSLPLNLQAKAGTFFTEFGRLNPFHPHAWEFADQPLVNGRFLGPDGLRNPGVRLSWLTPTSTYTELFLTIQDSQGETAYSFRNENALFGRKATDTRVHSMKDMLYTSRITTSFEVTDETTVLLGASGAFGPNSTGNDKYTQIYGLDMFWKWKSKYAAGGYPFVTWQTEVMNRRFEAGEDVNAGLPDEVMHNWGTYSQIAWGFKKRWIAGLRGDYVDGEKEATDPRGFERWRLTPDITFYPTEFSKIRLQYNYDDIIGNDSTEHSVFLQFEFLMGSHGAHKF